MKRLFVLLLVCSLCLSAVPVGTTATAASSDSYVSIDKVTVSPTPPTPGEEFTVFAAIRNLPNSSSNYNVQHAELRGGPGQNLTVHDETSVPGFVRPGERKYVRLTATIDDPGTYSLRLHVTGTNEAGERIHVQRTVEVQVGAERPQLSIDAADPVATADSTVNVTVANGLPSDARNVRVTVEGSDIAVENPRRVRSLLVSGSDETFDFTVRANSPGTHRVTAHLRYASGDGEQRTVTQHAMVNFSALSKRVTLDAKSAAEGSAVDVTLTNFGNVPVTNVVVSGESPNATLADVPIDEIDAGESKTVALNITRFETDGDIPVNVSATYEAGDATGAANTAVTIASNPGAIRLTGLEMEREDGKVHFSGSASNVGLTDANSVIVSVVPTEGVEPAHPNKEYFVGTVPSSDFVSFDVFADVDDSVSTVPLKVSFLVDGERRTYTVNVEYEVDDDAAATANQSSSGLLLPAAVGGVVVLVVGAIIVVAWRNSRDGT
ncbi:hypothetical protein [Halorussus caseinilyticus]|uniref:hypothetical protein n=1 Tax=Halorussus caseinilyticus TaxID=3034025 RepID=UPI0023E79EE0|nr:hypothetical protein [Halorussus sp. DT72]